MIIDRLENAHLYKGIHPAVDDALDYIAITNFAKVEIGRHKVSDQLDCIVDEYQTQSSEGNFYEGHKQFIDVQLILEGDEYMGYAPLTNQTPYQDYDAEKDFALYQIAGQMLHVKRGMFVIFFPTDLHMPCIGTPPRKIRKVVMKARVKSNK
jgi:YhcH/YjgK/YiaL family protein